MPVRVPVLRTLEACRGERTSGPLIQRPKTGNPIDRRDALNRPGFSGGSVLPTR